MIFLIGSENRYPVLEAFLREGYTRVCAGCGARRQMEPADDDDLPVYRAWRTHKYDSDEEMIAALKVMMCTTCWELDKREAENKAHGRLADTSFDALIKTARHKKQVERLKALKAATSRIIRDGSRVVRLVHGTAGTGKTTALIEMNRALRDARVNSSMVNYGRLISKWRECFSPDARQSEAGFIESFERFTVLIIDDIRPQARESEREVEFFFKLVDAIYQDGFKSLILSTMLTVSELEAYFTFTENQKHGNPLWGRGCEMGGEDFKIPFLWEAYR